MKIHFVCSLIFALSASVVSAEEPDMEAGELLVQENCLECHGTEIYTKEVRRVTSQQKLTAQVRRCELSLGLQWFDEDVKNTAEYLNHQYYKF